MLEDKMLKYLDTRFIGSKSLVETYIEQVVINEANDFVLTKSSTNKIVYELYLTVLLAVSKGHALMDLALRMPVHQEDRDFLKANKEKHSAEFDKSMLNALNLVNDEKNYNSFTDLSKTGNDSEISMKNVLQYFWEYETTMRRFYSAPVKPQKDGYVITGVRFKEENKMIYLQIQIGKLLAVGMVDAETVLWQEVQTNAGDDYIEFNYDLRQFNLNGNVMENEVLSGIQFVSENGRMKLKVFGKEHLNLEGTLSGNEKEYISQNSDVHRIVDKIPKLKKESKKFTKIIDKAIQFEVSNDSEDAGQSFVPYLDGSDIEFDVKAPLSGIGFMHYTNDDNYAGYIRPYLKSFKYKSFVKSG
ncbi:unnamed protein product [Diamesa serratosioi]